MQFLNVRLPRTATLPLPPNVFVEWLATLQGVRCAKDQISTVRDRAQWISLFGDSYAAHRRLDEAQARFTRVNPRGMERKAFPVGAREAARVVVGWHRTLAVWWANTGLRHDQLLSIQDGPDRDELARAIEGGFLFVKMYSDRSKTSDYKFYVPIVIVKELEGISMFPLRKEVVDLLLHQVGAGSERVTAHGFRRGLATSLRVALAKAGCHAKADIPTEVILRIAKIFNWAQGAMFWNYSADYQLHMSKAFLTTETTYEYCLGPVLYGRYKAVCQ